MEDLEDGEVVDSDGHDDLDIEKVPQNVNGRQPDIVQCINQSLQSRHMEIHSYRTSKTLSADSDVSEASSDEDSVLWNCKRAKYLSSQRAKDFCSERNNNPGLSKTEHFIHSPRKQDAGVLSNSSSTTTQKKRNNIWGAVIQEQTLTQGVQGFGVDKEEGRECDRNVESYDYTKSQLDTRLHVEADLMAEGPSCDDLFGEIVDLEPNEGAQDLKRKRPAKYRIGKRTFDKTKSREHIGVTCEDSVPKVVNAMVTILNEPKVDLMHRVVDILGKKKSLELLYLTEDTEQSGGMFIMNGERRRTAGGVFIQLLKMDMDVTKAHIKEIFAEEEKLKVKHNRDIRRKKLKKKFNETRMEEDGEKRNSNGTNNSKICNEKIDDSGTMLEILPDDEISLS